MSLRLFGRVAQSAPIGYLPNGFPIFRIYGAEGDGGQGNGNNTGNAGNEGNNNGGNANAGSDGDGKGKDGEDGAGDGDGDGDEGKEGKEALASALKRMKAADKRAADAEKKLADLAKKDMDEKTRAETERDEAKKAVDAATDRLKTQSIQIEFLQNNKYSWNNPKAALKLLDLDEVEIDDDGKVTGLDKAIEALAKSDPYLLKSTDGDGKDDGKNGTKPPSGKSGGQPKNNKNGGNSGGNDRERLETTYPSLRGRVGNPV